MIIYIGADHQGFELKNHIKGILAQRGYTVVDLGNQTLDPNDDYPQFAKKVAEKVSIDFERSKGIVVCGSGVGVDIVANKYPNVRSALAATADQAFDSRTDDDTNVLALAARYASKELAEKIVLTWIQTPFTEEERHMRRLKQIGEIEVEAVKRIALAEGFRQDDDPSRY